MNSLGKITVLLTILLLIFCVHASWAERTELTTTLPGKNLDRAEKTAKEFGFSIEAGGALSSIMCLAYSDLDLPKMESTWTRLLRETIALNEGLVANTDPAELHDPTANRVEPGTTLQLPAIAAVEEGDNGIGRVLIRLNPKLKGNGRALIVAIKATITANADLVRKADLNQLRDGKFNVIVVGDILILPPEVLPSTPAIHPVQQPAMVADTAAEIAPLPTGEEKPVEIADQIAAIVLPEPDETEAPLPTGEEKPVEIADQIAAIVLPEPDETEAPLPAGEEKPVEIADQIAAIVLPEPDETEAPLPTGEEKPVEIADRIAASVLPEPDETEDPIPTSEEKLVETADRIAAVVEPVPEQTEDPIPASEEKLEETAVLVAAVVEPVPEQTEDPIPASEEKLEETAELVAVVIEPEPLDAEPYSAIIAEVFDGPIGLTAWETRRPAKPVKKTDLLAGGNLLLAYLLAGLALLGLFILLIVRWLERDKVFREQFNLLLTALVFLITFGRVKRTPLEWTEEEKDPLAIPDLEAPRLRSQLQRSIAGRSGDQLGSRSAH